MLQQIARPDGFDAFLDKVKGQREPLEQVAGEDAHRFRILVGEEGQQGGYGAESGREEDEKGQFFFRIDGHLVEGGQQFPVGALGARGIRVEEMATLEGVGQHPEGALPGTVQKVERTLDVLPVLKVEEGVGQRFRVSTFEDVLRGKD